MSTFSSSAWRVSPAFATCDLAVGAPVGDHRLDLGVLARVQDLEREILELPLERVDAEAVRERRVHLERLLRLAHLRLLALVLDRPHVVEPVGELDQDDADVLRHRDDHLPVVLGLRLLAALEGRAGQLRDALDHRGDLVAELDAKVVEVGLGVLDDVVQERGGDRLVVEPQLGADLRRRPRVVDERLARPADLALVRGRRVVERTRDQLLVDRGVVRLDCADELVDEVLVMPLNVNDSHHFQCTEPSLRPKLPGRTTRCSGERRHPCSRRDDRGRRPPSSRA